jgi:MoxR-like ATPase
MMKGAHMMAITAGRPLLELVKLCYSADIPLLLVGRHGVGKSVLLEEAANKLKINYICRDLSLMEPTDLIGIPFRQGKLTRYAAPSFLPAVGKGLLVFEEINRCQAFMRATCLQLLTARSLNDYKLPPGWLPCGAINPVVEAYDVTELDPALCSRFVIAIVLPDREEWLTWARANSIHPSVIRHAESDRSIFDPGKKSLKSWSEMESSEISPRSLTYVSQLLQAAERIGTSREILLVAISGVVGTSTAFDIMKTHRVGAEALTADMCLNYSSWRTKLMGWVAAGQQDLVETSLLNLLKFLQVRRNFEAVRADHSDWRNLGAFLADLPDPLRRVADDFFQEHEYPNPRCRKRA